MDGSWTETALLLPSAEIGASERAMRIGWVSAGSAVTPVSGSRSRSTCCSSPDEASRGRMRILRQRMHQSARLRLGTISSCNSIHGQPNQCWKQFAQFLFDLNPFRPHSMRRSWLRAFTTAAFQNWSSVIGPSTQKNPWSSSATIRQNGSGGEALGMAAG